MLTIRTEQMDALAAAMRPSLIERLVNDVREHFARHCEILGDEQLRKTVALGVDSAAGYGLASEREVFLYLCLMFMLGSFFDTDPQLPWAARILAADNLPDGFAKVQALYKEAMGYLDRTIGKNDMEHLKVLLRVRNLDLNRAAERLQPDFTKGSIALLHEVHPRKAELLGDDILEVLVVTGSEAALEYGLSHERGRLVFLLHMFLMGSGFDRDPQFPWAAAILNDTTAGEEDEVADRLCAATIDYLNRTLTPVEKE